MKILMVWQALTGTVSVAEYAGWYIARRMLGGAYQYMAHKDEVFIVTTSFSYLKGRMKTKQISLL